MAVEHTIGLKSGEKLAAVHHPCGGDRWIFFCHGFRSDKHGSYEERCERAVAAGFDAVRFDFRGSGDSDRPFVETNLTTRIADLEAVVDHFDPPSYALFGSSFGAKTAFHAAADAPRLRALVGRAPVTYNRVFDAYREAVEREGRLQLDSDHAISSAFFEDFETYDFEAAAAQVDVPVALFHGRADATVPLESCLDAVGALETDVRLQTYTDEGHRFSEAAEQRLREAAFAWLDDSYGG